MLFQSLFPGALGKPADKKTMTNNDNITTNKRLSLIMYNKIKQFYLTYQRRYDEVFLNKKRDIITFLSSWSNVVAMLEILNLVEGSWERVL